MPDFVVPSYNDWLKQIVSDYTAITTAQGNAIVPDPNSEVYARLATQAQIAALISYLFSNQIDQRLLDTTTGSDLDRIAASRNIYRKGAVKAQGQVTFAGVSPQTIEIGSLLSGPNSLQYQVNQTGVYSNGQQIPILSVNGGANTNLEVGETLTWINQPYNAQSTVVVYTPITGGADAESDDLLRSRCIGIVQYPPQAGNASQVQNNSAYADPLIQQAFLYADYNKAGTLMIVLVGNQTTSYIGRDIPHLPLDNYIAGTVLSNSGQPLPTTNIQFGLTNDPITTTPYNSFAYLSDGKTLKNYGNNLSNATQVIYGQLPLHLGNQYTTAVTTVNNIPVSMALALELPYPPKQNGWVNNNTFPNPDGIAIVGYCEVLYITSSASFVVSAASLFNNGAVGPTAGVTQISWVNRSNAQNTGWLVQTATILTATDLNNNSWAITIDQPFAFPSGYTDFYNNTGLAVGDYIFPASTNAQSYLEQILTSFSQLGPGEMTTAQGLLQLGGSRFPSSAAQYPEVIDDTMLTPIENNNQEVISANYVIEATTNKKAIYNSVGVYIYNTPPTANAPPGIYVPYQIGFYDAAYVNYLS